MLIVPVVMVAVLAIGCSQATPTPAGVTEVQALEAFCRHVAEFRDSADDSQDLQDAAKVFLQATGEAGLVELLDHESQAWSKALITVAQAYLDSPVAKWSGGPPRREGERIVASEITIGGRDGALFGPEDSKWNEAVKQAVQKRLDGPSQDISGLAVDYTIMALDIGIEKCGEAGFLNTGG